MLIFETYENQEIADIVRNICRQVEAKTGIVYNDNKIYDVDYDIKKIVFDGVSAKEALEQLSEFATDFVYGVDEYREFSSGHVLIRSMKKRAFGLVRILTDLNRHKALIRS